MIPLIMCSRDACPPRAPQAPIPLRPFKHFWGPQTPSGPQASYSFGTPWPPQAPEAHEPLRPLVAPGVRHRWNPPTSEGVDPPNPCGADPGANLNSGKICPPRAPSANLNSGKMCPAGPPSANNNSGKTGSLQCPLRGNSSTDVVPPRGPFTGTSKAICPFTKPCSLDGICSP